MFLVGGFSVFGILYLAINPLCTLLRNFAVAFVCADFFFLESVRLSPKVYAPILNSNIMVIRPY